MGELAEGPSPGMEEGEFRESTMCNKPNIGFPQDVSRDLSNQKNFTGASSKFVNFWKVAGGKALIPSPAILAKCQHWQRHSQTQSSLYLTNVGSDAVRNSQP
jgi:hypothetical protein